MQRVRGKVILWVDVLDCVKLSCFQKERAGSTEASLGF